MLNIKKLRKEYQLKSLDKEDLHLDPFIQFWSWLDEAQRAGVEEPNAMCLATATPEGHPSNRMILLKGVDETGFLFYTNYNSRKGKEIKDNPRGCAAFYWKELERQIIINGTVERLSKKESEDYFMSRPRGGQIASWASHQDEMLESRQSLEKTFEHFEKLFEGRDVPLPEYWGGYRLIPQLFEFWQGRPNRMHDRFRYSKMKEGNNWLIERISP